MNVTVDMQKLMRVARAEGERKSETVLMERLDNCKYFLELFEKWKWYIVPELLARGRKRQRSTSFP